MKLVKRTQIIHCACFSEKKKSFYKQLVIKYNTHFHDRELIFSRSQFTAAGEGGARGVLPVVSTS